MSVLQSLGLSPLGTLDSFSEQQRISQYDAEQARLSFSRSLMQRDITEIYPEKERTLFEYFSDLGLTKKEMQKALFQAYKEKVNG